MAEIHDQFDTILILDFGSQVSFFEILSINFKLTIALYSTVI